MSHKNEVKQGIKNIGKDAKVIGVEHNEHHYHYYNQGKQSSGQPNHITALAQVRRLSLVAAKDAGFIADDPGGHPSGEIRLEQDLYVHRTIEETAYELFNTGQKDYLPFIMVVGEAGFGKTSMLWNFHRTMGHWSEWEPWFIKSTFLMGQSSEYERGSLIAKPIVSFEQLQFAVTASQSEGKNPILLLDTADLLLGNENDRDLLINILSLLREYGCAIVIATRPQEASYLRSLEHILRLDLRDYNDKELEDAVFRHVARFYAYAGTRQPPEHVERIRNAVARGLPVRDVCTNPLTLRMLFTLYAPEEISLEINAFKLYENFWNMRVVKDHRAGNPYSQHRTDNLVKTASAVALIMLAEGTPEIDNRLIDNILPDIGGSVKELKQLISRGIIHQSEGQTIRFFHQTFFEHSAARGLLERFRDKAIGLLQERMKNRMNDLFINPVFEHLLLLCEFQPIPIRYKAENAFKQLITNKAIFYRNSAIYIYAHQQRINNDHVDIINNIFRNEELSIIVRFVNIAHNMPHRRLHDLLKHLDVIWSRNKWEEQYHILGLLERLVARAPELIKPYLLRHQILDIIDKMPPLGYQILLKTLIILVDQNSNLCDDQLAQKLIDILTSSGSRNLQATILDTLCEFTKKLQSEEIPRSCEKILQVHQLDTKDSRVAAGFGNLFLQSWYLSKTPLNMILSKIQCIPPSSVDSWLYGLSGFLLTNRLNESESTIVWQRYKDEPEMFRQWKWSSIVLP